MAIDGGKINAFLELDTSGYSSAMKMAQGQLGILDKDTATARQKFSGVGKAMQTLGTQMTVGVTVPVLAAGAAAVKSAIDYESAFAGVRKTVDATEAEYAALSDGLMDMSEKIPQSASDLAAIAEIAGQLGVDKGNLLEFTEVIANLGVATNLSGEEAATMLAQYANITGMDLADIDRLGSVIVALGNSCATTEKDITEMAQRLAGTGALLGLSDAQIMGLSATMASLGIGAEAGGSAMSRTLQTINSAVLSGGDDLKDFAKAAGVTASEFSKQWKADPVKALDTFLAGIKKVNDAGGDAAGLLGSLGLSDLRIVDTLLRMSNAQGDLAENIRLANSAWDENAALQEESDKRYSTTESQLQLAKNSVTNMMTSLGTTLLPMVAQGADFIGGLADGFAALDGSTQSAILGMVGVAAAIGPVTTVVGTLLTALSSPVGLIAVGGIAAATLVGLFAKAGDAAIRADLVKRFGDVQLSAEEMDSYISGLLGDRMSGFGMLDTYMADTAKSMRRGRAHAVNQLCATLG